MKKSIMLAILISGFVSSAENIVVNGTFDTDTKGWKGQIAKEGIPPATEPSFVIYDSGDGANGSKGCLKATITVPPDTILYSHDSGLCCQFRKTIPASSIKVTFFAKNASEYKELLSVGRLWAGGSFSVVELSKEWKKYEVTLELKHETLDIIFATVGNPEGKNFQKIQNGSFLIDDVVVEEITK